MRPDEKITQVVKSIVDVASLPSVARRALTLLHEEGLNGQGTGDPGMPAALADVIATDVGLTAQVLRLVNSRFFSRKVPISSVAEASAALGVPTLKSILLSASVVDGFHTRCRGLDPVRAWRHSMAVAMACRRLARCFFDSGEDDLYVAGLLHDAGVVVMAQYLPEDYAFVLETARESCRPLEEVEREVFGMSHADVGYTLATRWGLPNVLGKCIRGHANEYTSLGSIRNLPADFRSEQWRFVDIVRFANRWARFRGISLVDLSLDTDVLFPDPPAWFCLRRQNWKALLDEVEAEFEERAEAVCPRLQMVG
jgi:HD-like signal output (HDOD) protein